MDRMGSEPTVSVKWSVSIGTMINFDGDGRGHSDGYGTCKQVYNQGSHRSGKSGKLLKTFSSQKNHGKTGDFQP